MRQNRRKTKNTTIVILIAAIVAVQFAIFFVWRTLGDDKQATSKDTETAAPLRVGSPTENLGVQPVPEKTLEIDRTDDTTENIADTSVPEDAGVGSENPTGTNGTIEDVSVALVAPTSVSDRNQPQPNETRRQKIARERRIAREDRALEKLERKRAAAEARKRRLKGGAKLRPKLTKKGAPHIKKEPLAPAKKNGSNVLTPDLEDNPYMHD